MAPSDALKNMWETGDWSDLTIIAGGKHFKVHKSVVCHGSPVIKAECIRDWEEARTGIITLPESASVIEELLAHLYGVLSPWVDDSSVSLGADELLSLRIAADKYQVEKHLATTESEIIDAFKYEGWSNRTMLLIDLGTQIYDLKCPAVAPERVLRALLWATAYHLEDVLSEQAAWNKLVACTGYYQDVMRCISACVGRIAEPQCMESFRCGPSAK